MFTSLPRPAATILVIDDERISRGVAYRILSDESYRVLEAETCSETLDALHLAQGRVDLLMIDVVMPDCDGVAVGRHVLEQWPDQRILYMSAQPAEVLARHRLTALDVPFLAKPYTRGEVLARVKEALEKAPQRKRVLVMDDESSICSSLREMLTVAGYEVMLAANGSEATRLWREHGADLVIVDLCMPEKDGIETIVELRALTPAIQIIAMSGGGADGSRLDLLKDAGPRGAFQSLEKPFTAAEMLSTIRRALRGGWPRRKAEPSPQPWGIAQRPHPPAVRPTICGRL